MRMLLTMAKSAFLGFVLLSISSYARAGTATDVLVSQLVPGMGGFTFIVNGGARTQIPQCATNLPNTWAVDVSNPQGQAVAATVITAFSMGKRLYIGGTGSCPSFQPNGESVFFIAVSS